MRNITPHRLVSYLGTTFGCLVFAYLALVVTTVILASEQTRLAASVTEGEAAIGTLETQYYTAINTIDAMNPSALDLVTPTNTAYARATTMRVAFTGSGE